MEYALTDLLVFIIAVSVIIHYFTRKPCDYFKIKSLYELSPQEFEIFCSHYLRDVLSHERVSVTPPIKDGGKDIVSYYNGRKYYTECKRYKGCVGYDIVTKAYGVARSERARTIVATTGYFSKDAVAFAKKNNIMLIRKKELDEYRKSSMIVA